MSSESAAARLCVACGSPVTPEKRICDRCGTLALRHCPECGAATDHGARYCSACGHKLDGGRSSQAQPEFRQITALFCDMVGFTVLTNDLDAEDANRLMVSFADTVSAVVRSNDGSVARFEGDGLLAYFGYPQARDDDAERAVRAGLSIVRAVQAMRIFPNVTLQVRVGIATGAVVIGQRLGDGVGGEVAASGRAVNLAARLKTFAEPGTVVLSQSTRKLIGNLFQLVDLGGLQLKGFAQPERAWQATAERPTRSRFEALHPRMSRAPLAGRETERAALLQAWARACKGHGEAVFILGEPGIGKSRLTHELLQAIRHEPHFVVRCYCAERFESTQLHPFIGLVEREAAIGLDDPPTQKLAKIERLFARATPAEQMAETIPYVAALLGIPFEQRYRPLSGSPELHYQRLLVALRSQIALLSRHRPVLIVAEDLQWADHTSLELMSQMIDDLRSGPVMFVGTARNEIPAGLSDRPNVTALRLQRLHAESAAAMIAYLASGKPVSQAVMGWVLTHSEGVPLYVEELTKTILEGGSSAMPVRDEAAARSEPIGVPSTLRDSLMARLDRLHTAKEVAQIGAVIGRQFPHDLLAAVSGVAEPELSDLLRRLAEADVVQVYGTPPGASYGFRHALIHDEAYGSMLSSRRRELHRRVASVLEAGHPETAHLQPELLAHHYTRAGALEAAVEYWRRAGANAARRFANTEAIARYAQGLEALRGCPDSETRKAREVEFHVAVGQVQIAARGYASEEAAESFGHAYALRQHTGSGALRLAILKGITQHLLARASYGEAQRYAAELTQLADADASLRQRVDVHLVRGLTCLYNGWFTDAKSHLERGMAAFLDSSQQDSAGPSCAAYLARTYWFLGYPDRALTTSVQAVAIARTMHEAGLAPAFGMLAVVYSARGDLTSMQEWVAATIGHANERQHVYWALLGEILEGWLCAQRERTSAAAAMIADRLERYTKNGTRLGLSWLLLLQAEACGYIGDLDQALATVGVALRHAEQTGEGYYLAEVHRRKGELVLARSGASAQAEAEACYRRALQIARSQHARAWELRAATSLARLLCDRGRRDQARGVLLPVYQSFTEGHATRDLSEAGQIVLELGG